MSRVICLLRIRVSEGHHPIKYVTAFRCGFDASSEEPEARVACEIFATTNRVVIGGEVGLSNQDKLQDYMGVSKISPVNVSATLGMSR